MPKRPPRSLPVGRSVFLAIIETKNEILFGGNLGSPPCLPLSIADSWRDGNGKDFTISLHFPTWADVARELTGRAWQEKMALCGY